MPLPRSSVFRACHVEPLRSCTDAFSTESVAHPCCVPVAFFPYFSCSSLLFGRFSAMMGSRLLDFASSISHELFYCSLRISWALRTSACNDRWDETIDHVRSHLDALRLEKRRSRQLRRYEQRLRPLLVRYWILTPRPQSSAPPPVPVPKRSGASRPSATHPWRNPCSRKYDAHPHHYIDTLY
jgi:hypothetical protein